MNYRGMVVPYLSNQEIASRVEHFRIKFWDNTIPVNIEAIIDLKLSIDIIPIPCFLKHSGIDAFITSDWKSIYVDREEYLDERRHNRLRFSLAHEISHFVLHQRIYRDFKINSLEDYYKLNREIPMEQYGYLEVQANKFANQLLIPREALKAERVKELKKKSHIAWFEDLDIKILNSYLAIPLSKVFKVSEEATTIALNDL